MNLFSHRISTPSCYNGGISPRWDRSEEDDKLKAPIPVRIQGPSIIGLRTFCSYGCCFVSSSALRFLCSACHLHGNLFRIYGRTGGRSAEEQASSLLTVSWKRPRVVLLCWKSCLLVQSMQQL
jgi:hypothetical protein